MIINKKWRYIFLAIFCLALIALYVNSATWFRLKLVDYYIQNNSYDKAITIYEKILLKETIDARHQILNIKDISNIRFILANNLLTKRRFIEAAGMVKQIVKSDPAYKIDISSKLSKYDDYVQFALALWRVGFKKMAIEELQKAIAMDPKNLSGYCLLTWLYKSEGAENRALIQLRKVVELVDESSSLSQIDIPSYFGDFYYSLGLWVEKSGNIEKAKDYFKKAVTLDVDRMIDAYYRLTVIYNAQDSTEEAKNIETKFLNLKPEYEVNYTFHNKLKFLGYSLNEKQFELFNQGKVIFFWETSNQNSKLTYEQRQENDFYKIGNRLYQVKDVNNLAPNFGFNINSIGIGFPYGWDNDCYYALTQNHEIVSESLPLGKTQCLLLNNSVSERTNCQTDYIDIVEDSFYLQAGWIKSIDGNAYLGRKWFDLEKNDNGYDYVVLDVKLPNWKYYSQVTQSHPDRAYCRLWLTNFMTRGKAYFAEIIFFKLELPYI